MATGTIPFVLEVICNVNIFTGPKGIKVTDAEFAAIYIVKDDFHGDWNYSICPRDNL